ncbi:MAG: hypothetical protein PHD72_04425 [Patescibacteria group bacterium]|nr:hypothetical protein [Patescibacteria group bacterium]
MREGNPDYAPKPSADSKSVITPEKSELHEKPTKEMLEILACFLKDHPEATAPVETRRDCENEKRELQILFDKFETAHSLEELHAIKNVSPELDNLFSHARHMSAEQIETALAAIAPEDAKRYKIRFPAIDDLIPVMTLMNKIEKETNITAPEMAKLKTAFRVLARAVGKINNGVIDHTR